MNPSTIIDNTDTVLHSPCEKYNWLRPQCNLPDTIETLVSAMSAKGGIGLSANQIGIPLQIFVMRGEKPIVVINPNILESSDETIELEEGCLSYPGVLVKVRRPVWVKARFNLPSGTAQTFRFEGITARVFQHEYDHIIHGKTMLDSVSKLKKNMALKKLVKKRKV